jgi:hypothetical protein
MAELAARRTRRVMASPLATTCHQYDSAVMLAHQWLHVKSLKHAGNNAFFGMRTDRMAVIRSVGLSMLER